MVTLEIEILRREGIVANHKRVYQLWRQEGLCLPRRRRRKRAHGADQIPCTAAHPGHVWTYDFIHDACSNGRKLKILTVEDEFTRECLALVPETSLCGNKVIAVLERLFAAHGPPQLIRSDNGPEFIARLVQRRLAQQHTQTVYIEPGKPWQNGFVESLHGKLRDECLSREVFASVREAKVITETWRQDYNQERPHSSLGNLTPLEFKAAWQQAQGAGGGPELESRNEAGKPLSGRKREMPLVVKGTESLVAQMALAPEGFSAASPGACLSNTWSNTAMPIGPDKWGPDGSLKPRRAGLPGDSGLNGPLDNV